MKLIGRDEMRVMPWKNGGGVTIEIAIENAVEPVGKNAAADHFSWRLSSAAVEVAGPFSRYDQYDRLLMVLNEPGLELNGQLLRPHVEFHFRGEDDIFCRPLGTGIKDLGVIYQRGKFRVEMNVLKYDPAISDKIETLSESSTCFIFDSKTENAWRFDPRSKLDLTHSLTCPLTCFQEENRYILVRITRVGP